MTGFIKPRDQSVLDAWQAEYEVYAKDKNVIAEQLLNQADDISVYILNMAKSREGSKWVRNHTTNLKLIEHRFWEAQQLTKGADSETAV